MSGEQNKLLNGTKIIYSVDLMLCRARWGMATREDFDTWIEILDW